MYFSFTSQNSLCVMLAHLPQSEELLDVFDRFVNIGIHAKLEKEEFAFFKRIQKVQLLESLSLQGVEGGREAENLLNNSIS